MNETIQQLRTIFGEPNGPFYGSDVVPIVADLCEQAEQLQAENEKLQKRLAISPQGAELAQSQAKSKYLQCPCGGWLEGVGVDINNQQYVYQCDKCGSQMNVDIQALKGGE